MSKRLSETNLEKGSEFVLRNLIIDLEETVDGIQQQEEKDFSDKVVYAYSRQLLDSIRSYLQEARN